MKQGNRTKLFKQKDNSDLDLQPGKTIGKKSLKSGVCKESFKLKQNLNSQSLNSRCNKEKLTHQCDFCSKSFAKKNHLIMHRRNHTVKNLLDCEFCEKSFAIKGNLDAHRRIHTGDKPFQCKVCDKWFTQKGNLV